MAITHAGTFSGSTVSESTRAYTTVTLGDLVVLTDATSSASARATAVSGGGCAVWTEIAGAQVASSTGAITTITMWWGKVTTTGSVTASVTRQTSPGNCQIDVDQWTAGLGANTVWTVQSADASIGPSGSATMAFPTLTPTAPALYVGYAVTSGGGSAGTTETGFTKNVDSYFTSVRCYNLNVTAAASPTCGQDNTSQYARSAALFTASTVSTVTGTAAAPLGALTATASGVRSTAGTAAAPLGGLTASAAATVVHAGGKIATFVDNFTTADTAKWVFNGSTVSSGQLQVPCTTAYPYAYAASSWDLTASSCSLELVQLPPAGVGTTSTYVVLEATSGNDVRFVIEDSGTLYARHTVAGTPTTMATAAYDATNHRWLRISESGGVVTWSTSPDSTTWATFATWTVSGLTLTAVFPSLTCGYWGAETSPGPAVFDNFNIALVAGTAAAPLGALTAAASGVVTAEVITATAAAPLGGLTATASGIRSTAGTASAPLGGLTASATGTAFTGPNAQATLGALTAAAAGTRTTGATATAPLGALTATASGTRTSTGATATATLGALTATAAQAADGPEPGRFFLVY